MPLELFILKVKFSVKLSVFLELVILKVYKLVHCYEKSVYARLKEEKRKKSNTKNFLWFSCMSIFTRVGSY